MSRTARLRHSLRKSAKWGGLAATLFLCAIWLGSAWWSFKWLMQWGGAVLAEQGCIGLGWYGDSALARDTPCLCLLGPGAPPNDFAQGIHLWDWEFELGQKDVYGFCGPAWFPLLLTGTITALAFRADAIARRRARIGACAACGYELKGLPPNAPCPECGRNPKAQSAAAPRTEDGTLDSSSPPR